MLFFSYCLYILFSTKYIVTSHDVTAFMSEHSNESESALVKGVHTNFKYKECESLLNQLIAIVQPPPKVEPQLLQVQCAACGLKKSARVIRTKSITKGVQITLHCGSCRQSRYFLVLRVYKRNV
jgi:hypothetical protein